MQVAESRLETYLSRAEEATSDHTGESQAKLARQIETLQNSYTVATENWREIEKSLLAQVSRLESELSDACRREADVRRKAKDCFGRCKDLEVEVERATQEAQDAREKWIQERGITSNLQAALRQAQQEVANVVPFTGNHVEAPEKAEQASDSEANPHPQQSLEPPLSAPSPATSPLSEAAHWTNTGRLHGGNGNSTQVQGLNVPKRPATGRANSQVRGPLQTREGSPNSIAPPPGREASRAPTLELAFTPTTPDQTINDMFSVSTAAAGPSVQLVERMSASVRRLESEKTALKDELERHIAQRGEAREQILALMGEVDEKREAERRVEALERQVEETSIKLATTLEMLGEKSELVEELQADIADMKEIYRSTLENAVR